MREQNAKRVPVLVTGVGGGGFGEQILKALRYADTPYEIVGTDSNHLSKGFASVDHCYVVPRATDAGYVDALLTLCDRHHARAIFVGSEAELRTLSGQRNAFEDAGVFLPINPPEVIDTCLDKYRTAQFLANAGFLVPRSFRIDNASQLDTIDVFPVVLKPNTGGGGSADVMIAQDRNELFAFGHYLLANGRTLLVQEYVGTPQAEFTVGVLTTMTGELVHSIAVRRMATTALSTRVRVPNRSGRADLGDTLVISSGISQGEIGPFPDVARPCEEIAAALGARGTLNIQCRYVEGRVVTFEINPRFSGTTSLRAMVGYNEPDILIREHVLGERVARRFPYRSGTILRGLDETLMEPGVVKQVLGR